MSKPHRLHPATILFNFIRTIRESIFLIILGFITFKGESFLYFSLVLSALVVLFITISVLSWYRFTYRIVEDELRIEYGIFIRKKRFISKNRIQSIDLTAGVIHRLFKLVKVQIETAGSGMNAEASLKAVTLQDGEQIRRELKSVRSTSIEESEIEEYPSQKISKKRLFIAGSTSGSIGVMLAIAAFGFSELEQFIPDDFYNNTYEWVIGLGLAIIVFLVMVILLMLWLLGIAGTMIKYGNFTITKHEDELFITRGLLEKKQITIPLKRIQAVGMQESVIRQPLGFVTVYAEVAGGSLDQGEEFSTVLFPILKANEVEGFLEKFLPTHKPTNKQLQPLPKRARKFYVLRSIVPFVILAGVAIYFYPQFSWVPIVLLVGSLYLGLLRYKDGGILTEDKRLTVRFRVLNKNTVIIFHKRIQAFEKKQHKIQKFNRLATISLSIVGKLGVGKHYKLKDLDESNTDVLADWYSYRK
ncbi:PH domain-containing protein [Ornithinibacillus sp. L9]|uniref:PH domain-containing protein n=2 Tax=Ornithinibacillus caprae TaxID=2678566 RepID=A0A6N8FJ82_9BACI|nr:PH domain-containing protein [Ornithinibacillus caprae]